MNLESLQEKLEEALHEMAIDIAHCQEASNYLGFIKTPFGVAELIVTVRVDEDDWITDENPTSANTLSLME